MKGRLVQKESAPEHIIPLSTQSLEILKRLHDHTRKFKFLFPNVHNPRNSVMSGDTINKALKVMGFDGLQTGHGFRWLEIGRASCRERVYSREVDECAER